MQKLIAQLTRLYFPAALQDDAATYAVLAQRLQGHVSGDMLLAGGDCRVLAIRFPKVDHEGSHWTRLCEVAQALQGVLGLPAPAVSVSGQNGFVLWLSFAAPLAPTRAQDFLQLLHAAYFPDFPLAPDAATAPVELPPCLHEGTGRWAAFIHPGMGASFADEAGLDVAPPFAAQAAFLDSLESISSAQLAHALALLKPAPAVSPAFSAPVSAPGYASISAAANGSANAAAMANMPAMAAVPVGGVAAWTAGMAEAAMQAAGPVAPTAAGAAADGLLLKDATLEDIVKFLHAKNIEPTFRHLLPGRE